MKLYCVGISGNSYKVALYLNCAGLDWEPVGVDFAGGQTRDAGWRDETNDMGEVPVLEADGRRISQSGAILTWLAETTGKFAPVGENQRIEALRWLLFDNHKFSGNYSAHRVAYSLQPQEPDPAVLAFLRARIDAAFVIVEKHLSDRPFILGDIPTIVDFSMVGYMYFPSTESGIDVAATWPAIHRWSQRMAQLPGWKLPRDLMPVGKSLPPRTPAR